MDKGRRARPLSCEGMSVLNWTQLEEQIEAQMSAAHVPGFALAVVQGLEVVYAEGFGLTAIDGDKVGLPVTPQTLFRIGSITKPLTGTAVMRLVEAGQLDLDQPVRTYVPWLTFSEEGAANEITLRRLMSHTAGLVTAAGHQGARDPSGLEAFVREEVPKFALVAPPGKLYSYSNLGLCIVGYIAEAVSGKPYTELMHELVFGPLEMRRTTFDPTVAMTYPLAQSHDLTEEGLLRVQHQYADNVGHYPAGFAISSALDMANWAIMQLNEGRFAGAQILSPDSVAEMQRAHADLYTPSGAGYGLTLVTQTCKGVRRVGHNGAISTFFSTLDMVPASKVAVITLSNRADESFQVGQIVDGILDQLLDLPETAPQAQPVAPDRSRWPAYVGTYVGDWRGCATVRVSDDQLILDTDDGSIPLHALRDDLYVGQKPEGKERVSVGFIPEESGPTQYILLNTAPCKRAEIDAAPEVDVAAWEAYVGQYHLPFDTVIVRIEGKALFAYTQARNEEVQLMPLGDVRFSSKYGVIEFLVAEDGTVTGLQVGSAVTFPRVEVHE
jgi:CubicO group peptidase (beta-lactamase class C family)